MKPFQGDAVPRYVVVFDSTGGISYTTGSTTLVLRPRFFGGDAGRSPSSSSSSVNGLSSRSIIADFFFSIASLILVDDLLCVCVCMVTSTGGRGLSALSLSLSVELRRMIVGVSIMSCQTPDCYCILHSIHIHPRRPR
jgi:hypothetical protein